MKTRNIIIPVATTLIGLLIGYFIFSSQEKPAAHADHTDHVEEVENQIWTCSMHPQIRKNEPGDCPICGMTLVPLKSDSKGNKLILEMTEEAIKLSNIQTTVIQGSDAQGGSLKVSGKILSDEENNASLVTQIPGRIEKLYVSFTGDQVNKGQKIALLYSPVLISAQRELLEAQKIKTNNPAIFEAAKNKLRNWKITDTQIESILSEQKIQEQFVIYADYSGVILNKKVAVGDHLKEGQVLFDIQNLSTVWVIFDAYENDLNKIKIGDKISFTTTALPGEVFESKVSFINPTINPTTRTVSIRAEINNSKKKLKPEMFVQGSIRISGEGKTKTQDAAILIPKSAVLWTGERSVVYLKLPHADIPSFKFREIQIGHAVGDQYVVLKGIKLGDEVVTNGAFVIDAAAQLNNNSSMMNRNVSKAK